ncbi:MAG: FecR domain-containing protein [Rhodospirillales bacterium]|nr:FecR domain-containing protein [Rhodospirillales bacterium]
MQRISRPYLYSFLALIFMALAGGLYAAEATDVVGKVVRIQNSAVAMQDALPRVLSEGSDIQLGDIISTGKGSRIAIEMSDGGELTLGERTHFVVQEYLAGQDGNNAVLRLLQGAFKMTSGKMMQLADASFVVQTDTATIGIRGTTIWGGALDGDFEVALLDGKGVYVETKAGRVDLTVKGDGTLIENADVAPTPPAAWPQGKLERAMATVDFN